MFSTDTNGYCSPVSCLPVTDFSLLKSLGDVEFLDQVIVGVGQPRALHDNSAD